MKLSYVDQIQHLKSKGITFKHVDEQQSLEYLQFKNHYFRLKSYCKNYQKRPDGTYIDLDIAYLIELARLDKLFRNFVVTTSLHLEHMLKQRLLKSIVENPNEDGYQIVQDFFQQFPLILSNILRKSGQSVCHDLIDKHKNSFSCWSVVEVLTFGELINFYTFYYQKYPSADNYHRILHHIKFLRNSSAHNNCLLNSMKRPYTVDSFSPSKEISSALVSAGIKPNPRTKVIYNPVLHDFVTMMYVLFKISKDSDVTRKYFDKALILFKVDFQAKQDYFIKNLLITSRFDTIIKFLDYYRGLL